MITESNEGLRVSPPAARTRARAHYLTGGHHHRVTVVDRCMTRRNPEPAFDESSASGSFAGNIHRFVSQNGRRSRTPADPSQLTVGFVSQNGRRSRTPVDPAQLTVGFVRRILVNCHRGDWVRLAAFIGWSRTVIYSIEIIVALIVQTSLVDRARSCHSANSPVASSAIKVSGPTLARRGVRSFGCNGRCLLPVQDRCAQKGSHPL
jgi:hypothetical protein